MSTLERSKKTFEAIDGHPITRQEFAEQAPAKIG
jgi:hypothetical protein